MSDQVNNNSEFVSNGTVAAVTTVPTVSPKSRLATALLCFFLGGLGIHRFYVGKVGSGILMLLLWGVGAITTWMMIGFVPLALVYVWSLIDLLVIIFGGFKDGMGLPIK